MTLAQKSDIFVAKLPKLVVKLPWQVTKPVIRPPKMR